MTSILHEELAASTIPIVDLMLLGSKLLCLANCEAMIV